MSTPRLSTLAEVRVLSAAQYLPYLKTGNITNEKVAEALATFKKQLSSGLTVTSDLFKIIGLAREVRIDEDWGTQNIYGIGSPTRPVPVPNNYSVNVSIAKLTLDTRTVDHYSLSPDYWYDDRVQRVTGIDDEILYTYLFVYSKEWKAGDKRVPDIYAVMPRSVSKAVVSGDTLIVDNAQLVGYKYSYQEAVFASSNLVERSLTVDG